MLSQGQVGPTQSADGIQVALRTGKTGEQMTSDMQARFYENNYRGTMFGGGMTLTSISAATFTTATLGATCTPIVGIYNPIGSGKNCVILQMQLQVVLTALTSTGPGAFMWCTNTGQTISTGNAPLNKSTLAQSGSIAKDMSGVALTGLATNLVVRSAAGAAGGSAYNISNVATAAGFQTTMAAVEDTIDGSWIVPPGGVLALLCTTTPVAHSAATMLLWNEVAI
jgi:hypothetical protein